MPWKDKAVRNAHMKVYYQLHPERREYNNEYHRKFYQKIKHQRLEAYKKLTPQQKLEKQNKALERNRQIRLEVLKHYGNGQLACVQCSEERTGCLSIDHINGDGNSHRRSLGNDNIFRWLKRNNYPLGFRTLCMNCQFCNRPRRIYNEVGLTTRTS